MSPGLRIVTLQPLVPSGTFHLWMYICSTLLCQSPLLAAVLALHLPAVESEARAEQLVQQVQACEAEIAARQSEVAEAQRQLEAWRGTVAELATTRQQLVEHVEGMFAAPAWRAYPRHAELADALAALSAQEAEVRASGGQLRSCKHTI